MEEQARFEASEAYEATERGAQDDGAAQRRVGWLSAGRTRSRRARLAKAANAPDQHMQAGAGRNPGKQGTGE